MDAHQGQPSAAQDARHASPAPSADARCRQCEPWRVDLGIFGEWSCQACMELTAEARARAARGAAEPRGGQPATAIELIQRDPTCLRIDASQRVPTSSVPQRLVTGWAFEHPATGAGRRIPLSFWVDGRDRLHCEDGPAVGPLWFLRGVPVAEHVVMDPGSLTLEEIHAEADPRVRAVLRERYGLVRYLRACSAELLDTDTAPVEAEAPTAACIRRALVRTPTHERYLVAADGSTRDVHAMRVPDACSTCRDAYVALATQVPSPTRAEA
jgi:hypothetical protein